MADTSFCRLALAGHRLRPVCRPNDPNEGLAEAKLIRQTRPRRERVCSDPAILG